MRRTLGIFLVLALILAACGDGDDATVTTAASSTSEETATAPESSSSSTAETTTSTAGSEEGAVFAITEINFSNSEIVITNVGTSAGSLAGYQICQRPNYSQVGDVTLGPGESTTIEASVVSGFDPGDGELGLYMSGQFDNSADIASYVEWGRSGHGRSSTAVAAGIWSADSFVATTADTAAISTDAAATSPDEWTVG